MEEKQTTVGGLRAIEMSFRPIREISMGRTVFYQSRTQLNTPNGVLMPEVFREVADYTTQKDKLFPLELMQTIECIKDFSKADINFEWLSVFMPVSTLISLKTEYKLLAFCDRYEISPNRICFALPEKLLAEDNPNIPQTITNIRHRGFHFMLTDFGGNGCPYMKLSEIDVDYVMISPDVTYYLGRSERSDMAVKSIITFVTSLDCETVADGVFSSRQAETLYNFGCNYCAGTVSGNYTPRNVISESGRK